MGRENQHGKATLYTADQLAQEVWLVINFFGFKSRYTKRSRSVVTTQQHESDNQIEGYPITHHEEQRCLDVGGDERQDNSFEDETTSTRF